MAIGAVVNERPEAGANAEPSTFYGWSYSGLHLFEVDTASGRIVRQGEMRVEEFPSSPYPIHVLRVNPEP